MPGTCATTQWLLPCIDDWDEADLSFQPENYWWQRTLECIKRFRQRCDGRLLIYATHLQGGLDCLAAMRGTERLLTDMVDTPDRVLDALGRVNTSITAVRTALANALDAGQFGSMNRFGMHCNGLIDVPQCDFSCMIGPEMFARFEMDCLAHETAGLQASVYHLDGPEAVRHLDAVCSLPDLDMIQWQPGAGRYDDDWSDLYTRIDRHGKGQMFGAPNRLSPDRAGALWRRHASRKIMLYVEPGAGRDAYREIEQLQHLPK